MADKAAAITAQLAVTLCSAEAEAVEALPPVVVDKQQEVLAVEVLFLAVEVQREPQAELIGKVSVAVMAAPAKLPENLEAVPVAVAVAAVLQLAQREPQAELVAVA